MEKTAVEFIFDAVYRDITFSELLGIIAQAKVMEKQQHNNKYSEEDLEVAYFEGREGLYSFNDWLKQFKK